MRKPGLLTSEYFFKELPMRILIAEDDFTSRTMLAAVLRKAGHEVTETVDGAGAWEELQKPDAPRLAILDWMMPEIEGVDLCRRVRSQVSTDPPYLILLTAKGDENSIVNGLDAGANDYLTKPYKIGELRARIGVGQRMLELQSDLNRTRDALAHEARHDFLTSILNRRAILDALSIEISRVKRQISTLSIGLCDIDHFKMVNDKYGHLVGDDLLQGFVRIIQTRLRDYDQFGRYGGEEFLVIAPGTGGSPEITFYEQLRSAVENTAIVTRAGALFITMSIGIVSCTGEESADELLAAADTALYRAKSEGRNRVVNAGNI
jgi:diguanylate cyclase (GGDEF)-like protein